MTVRLDKWLWAARFFKTRRTAVEAVQGGKVILEGVKTKPSSELSIGDRLRIKKPPYQFEIIVDRLSNKRLSAALAAELYHESEDSVAVRERLREQLKNQPQYQVRKIDGKPSKKDMRRLREIRRNPSR